MAAHDEKNFGLKEGMKVEIFSEGLIFLLNGVIDKIDEDAIWVTNAKGSEMPVIIHNSKVSIKAIRSDDTIIILHGAITGNSDTAYRRSAKSHDYLHTEGLHGGQACFYR